MMKRQYKDSGIPWIGMIPSDWEVKKIKQEFDLIAGATPKSDDAENWNGDIPWITPADYTTEQIYVYGGKRNLSHKGYDSCSTSLLPQGCLIFSKRAPIGLVAINAVPLCTNQGCLGCIPKKSVYANFVFYITSVLTEQFELFGSGTTFKEISANNFANFQLPIPPLPTQQRIADFLDRKCAEIDELAALQETMIAKLKRYKQSVITEAVTKGLDPDVPMKDSGVEWIGEIPEGWSVNKLNRLFSVIGSGTTPKATNDSYFEGNVNWIQSGDINGGYIVECKNKISEQVLLQYSALKIYKQPFIVVAMYGASVGNISISKIDGCVNQACCVMGYSNQHFDFLFYAIKSAKDYLIYRAEGGGQPNISQDKLRSLWLPVPPLAEQRAIADYLDQKCAEIDELIAIKQQKIEALKEYKKSVIFEYVTGKKEI